MSLTLLQSRYFCWKTWYHAINSLLYQSIHSQKTKLDNIKRTWFIKYLIAYIHTYCIGDCIYREENKGNKVKSLTWLNGKNGIAITKNGSGHILRCMVVWGLELVCEFEGNQRGIVHIRPSYCLDCSSSWEVFENSFYDCLMTRVCVCLLSNRLRKSIALKSPFSLEMRRIEDETTTGW